MILTRTGKDTYFEQTLRTDVVMKDVFIDDLQDAEYDSINVLGCVEYKQIYDAVELKNRGVEFITLDIEHIQRYNEATLGRTGQAFSQEQIHEMAFLSVQTLVVFAKSMCERHGIQLYFEANTLKQLNEVLFLEPHGLIVSTDVYGNITYNPETLEMKRRYNERYKENGK